MAVDANVLVFERIREELKTAKGPARAIELGYEKALSAILDANITTMITAVILLVMGSGPVQGLCLDADGRALSPPRSSPRSL